MAFRSTGLWKSMAKGLRGMATSTSPKMKAAVAEMHADHHHHGGGKRSPRLNADFVPVYVAVGMIALQAMFALHTAKQQLLHAPNVHVRKRRRETVPEVVEPEKVVKEAEEFVKKSFFRRVAHVQDPEHNYMVKDSSRGDVFAHPLPRAYTLKDIGLA